MHNVSIRDARAHLADIIDQVSAGGAVAITRRGREVARIVPAAQAVSPLPSRAAIRSAMVTRGATTTTSVVSTMRSEERW